MSKKSGQPDSKEVQKRIGGLVDATGEINSSARQVQLLLAASMNSSVEDAFRRLVEGNLRYVEFFEQHPHADREWRQSLVAEQHPFAVILTCADSRVVPELIFDQGIGDLFVVRVAGNVASKSAIASIEYAVSDQNQAHPGRHGCIDTILIRCCKEFRR